MNLNGISIVCFSCITNLSKRSFKFGSCRVSKQTIKDFLRKSGDTVNAKITHNYANFTFYIRKRNWPAVYDKMKISF